MERIEASAIGVLGTSIFKAEFATGAQLDRDVAIRLALGEPAEVRPATHDSTVETLLAKRETQVAELVTDGLSNKEIGARLFISERTVEGHVRSILNKLGFNSRAQIAAWVGVSNPELQ